MNLPSVKTLTRLTDKAADPLQTARDVRRVLETTDPIALARLAERLDPENTVQLGRFLHGGQYTSWQSMREAQLALADRLIGTCGVETCWTDDWIDHYYHYIRLVYCNAGASYAPTLVYDTARGCYVVACIADVMQSLEREGVTFL